VTFTAPSKTAPVPPAEAPARPRWTRDRVERTALRVLRPLMIAFLLISVLLPFYYMLLLSVRPIEDLLLRPASLLVRAEDFTLASYREVLASVDSGGQGFIQFIANSAVVALATVALALLIAIPGAYAISRLPFFGSRHVSALFLMVYLFPAIILAIPLFVVLTRLQLRGQLIGLVLVYVATTVPVAIYMLRNYFDTVPESVEEAGLIDGLTPIGVIRRVALPLSMPSIVVTGLFIFMIAWNEFLFALLFLVENRDRWTVSLGLSQLSGSVEVPTTVLMAGSALVTVPVIILFLLTERLLTEGLSAGAEKG
jgi:multiple sugar transport system permease protein